MLSVTAPKSFRTRYSSTAQAARKLFPAKFLIGCWSPRAFMQNNTKTWKKIRETRSKLTSADKRHPRSNSASAAELVCGQSLILFCALTAILRQILMARHLSRSRHRAAPVWIEFQQLVNTLFILSGENGRLLSTYGCVKLHFDRALWHNEFHTAKTGLMTICWNYCNHVLIMCWQFTSAGRVCVSCVAARRWSSTQQHEWRLRAKVRMHSHFLT